MIGYVYKDSVKVGDEIALEIKKGSELVGILQISTVVRVEPTKRDVDEIEFN